MDELNNDQLKRTFAKLEQYESEAEGVAWEKIKTSLPRKRFPVRRILATTLFLFLTGVSVFWFVPRKAIAVHSDIEKSVQTVPLSSPTPMIQQKTVAIPIAFKVERKDPRPGPGKPNVEKEEIVDSRNTADIGLSKMIRTAETAQPQVRLDSSIVLPPEDSIVQKAENVAAAKQKNAVSNVNLSIRGGYVFGIVDPITSDNIAINKYKFKPGFSLSAQLSFPLKRIRQFTLSAGPAYQMIYKKFQVEKTEVGSETISQGTFRASGPNHYLGLGLNVSGDKSGFQLGAIIYHSVTNNEINHFMGKNIINLSVMKEIKEVKGLGVVAVGGSFSTPLSGPINYFKYSPIQITLGLEKLKISKR